MSVDFDRASRQADILAQSAKGIYGQSVRLDVIANDLGGVWKGEAAHRYLTKLEAFSIQLRAEAKRCGEAAEAFHTRIAELKAAETEAQRLFSEGGNGGDSLPATEIHGLSDDEI